MNTRLSAACKRLQSARPRQLGCWRKLAPALRWPHITCASQAAPGLASCMSWNALHARCSDASAGTVPSGASGPGCTPAHAAAPCPNTALCVGGAAIAIAGGAGLPICTCKTWRQRNVVSATDHSCFPILRMTQRKTCRHVSRGHVRTPCGCFSSGCCAEHQELQKVSL